MTGLRRQFCGIYAMNLVDALRYAPGTESQASRTYDITNSYCIDKFSAYGKKNGYNAEFDLMNSATLSCNSLKEKAWINCIYDILHPKKIELMKLDN